MIIFGWYLGRGRYKIYGYICVNTCIDILLLVKTDESFTNIELKRLGKTQLDLLLDIKKYDAMPTIYIKF